MKPFKVLLFFLFIFCSSVTTYTYGIDANNDRHTVASKLVINIENSFSNEEVKITVQSFPNNDNNIESYNLVFDMKFREDYESEFTGICVGPKWEGFGSGEFSIILEKSKNFKSSISGIRDSSTNDRCENYFYYLRNLEINLSNGEKYLVGVATDYADRYPDAPEIWKLNKLNQIEEIGTSNIEKYSINFELSN